MLIHVPLDRLDDNPYQRRTEYGDLGDLAQRIHAKRRDFPDTYGLMQVPIGRIVAAGEPLYSHQAEVLLRDHSGWPGSNTHRVQIAFGHRRLRAFRLLAEQYPDQYGRSMPIKIAQLTDDQMLDACWSENRERRELSAVEEAELLAEKLERARAEGGNQATVAEAWGLSRPTVANRLRLLELPPEVQQANRDGRLSERQALALLSVTGLAQRLNGSTVHWHDNGPGAWRTPAPDDYMAQVVAEPDKATSDEIRQYVHRAAQHAGRALPDLVAITPVASDSVVQPLCKGCPRRFDQWCLHRPCFHVKARAIAERIARAAAEETGLPYSDDPAHFEWFGPWERNRDLRALYDAGLTDDIVIGYQYDGVGVRLVGGDTYGDPWADDGRRLVVLGHRQGKITAADRQQLVAGVETTVPTGENPKPPPALLREWDKRHKRICQTRELRGRAAVRAALEDWANPRLIRLLYALVATDGNRDRERVEVADLEKPLWEMARFRGGESEKWASFLAAAGLNPNAAESTAPEQRLSEMIIEAADDYFAFDSSWRRGKYAAQVVATCEALDRHPVALTSEIETAAAWLRHARPAAEKLLAAADQPVAQPTPEAA